MKETKGHLTRFIMRACPTTCMRPTTEVVGVGVGLGVGGADTCTNDDNENDENFVNNNKKNQQQHNIGNNDNDNDDNDYDDDYSNNKELVNRIMPRLVNDLIMNSNREKRRLALKKIHELCDANHKHNRIPMVCSTKYDVIAALCQRLHMVDDDVVRRNSSSTTTTTTMMMENENEIDDVANGDLHLACLALNNLSIPYENKAVMALGPSSKLLLSALTEIVRKERPESYLSCICLMNLAFLDDAAYTILRHCDDDDDDDDKMNEYQRKTAAGEEAEAAIAPAAAAIAPAPPDPLNDEKSLLRTMENVLNNYPRRPCHAQRSPEWETVRWIAGLLRNITRTEDDAIIVSRTDIPRRLVGYLQQKTTTTTTTTTTTGGNNNNRRMTTTTIKLSDWTQDSLEDSALCVLCNLARWTGRPRDVLRKAGALHVVQPIVGLGGIHDFRADMIRCCLESDDDRELLNVANEATTTTATTAIKKNKNNNNTTTTTTTTTNAEEELESQRIQHIGRCLEGQGISWCEI